MQEADLKPHQSLALVEPPPDPQFDEKVKDICEVYLSATLACRAPGRTISIDEMTGIQALERKTPDQPMRPGLPGATRSVSTFATAPKR